MIATPETALPESTLVETTLPELPPSARDFALYEFVAARPEGIDDLGGIVENRRIDQMCSRQIEFIEQLQAAPHAYTVAIVAPGKRTRIRWRVGYCEEVAFAGCEGEMFDIQTEIDGQSLAVGPRIVWSCDDWRIGVAIVIG